MAVKLGEDLMQRRGLVRPDMVSSSAEEPTGVRVEDPVCGMPVDPAESAGSARTKNGTVYFCSDHCRQICADDPRRYLERPE